MYNSATGWAVIALFCGTGRAWWEEVKGECRRAFFSVCLTEAGRLPHRVHRGCWGCSAACVWSIFLPSEAFWGSLGFPSEDEAVLVACESAVFVWDRSQISAGNSTAGGADLKPHQLPANASQCFSVEEKQSWMILQHRGVFAHTFFAFVRYIININHLHFIFMDDVEDFLQECNDKME